ncbi:2-hydroxychromene-2-carboxylate isomerase [Streptomyces cucumeris]|uniref:2-hydroxychromene-2-carboxylate isomerase n=1 Tax=Streptomyces cucumeris TaxID=2962890 RepID=UPI003D7449D0
MSPRHLPKFYFSLHSPYSWMATRLLSERCPEALTSMQWIPYFYPDELTWKGMADRGTELHYTDMSKAKHLYILQDVKRLSERFGYGVTWPVDHEPWWVLPHHAWMAAKRTGDQNTLYWALVEARWGRGENICDRETVRKVADAAGLDGEALSAAPEDPDLRAEGLDGLDAAYMDDVFGAPYFKIGPQRYWGLDRLDDFIAGFEQWRRKVEAA